MSRDSSGTKRRHLLKFVWSHRIVDVVLHIVIKVTPSPTPQSKLCDSFFLNSFPDWLPPAFNFTKYHLLVLISCFGVYSSLNLPPFAFIYTPFSISQHAHQRPPPHEGIQVNYLSANTFRLKRPAKILPLLLVLTLLSICWISHHASPSKQIDFGTPTQLAAGPAQNCEIASH
jgi:hypothetical protein